MLTFLFARGRKLTVCMRPGAAMSDFGLCATDARKPRQVRKEATVAGLSGRRRSTRSLAQIRFGF